jgi:hypothetical protein
MRSTLLPLALLAACAEPIPKGDCGTGDLAGGMPDFCLVDINPTSPRSGDSISPRDYLGEVSGWYFIHST